MVIEQPHSYHWNFATEMRKSTNSYRKHKFGATPCLAVVTRISIGKQCGRFSLTVNPRQPARSNFIQVTITGAKQRMATGYDY